MCVDDAGNGSAPGAAVQLTTCQNDAEQNWIVEPGGTIQINGLCLDTQGGGTAPGTPACWAPERQRHPVLDPGRRQRPGQPGLRAVPGRPGRQHEQRHPAADRNCDGSIEQAWPLPAAPSPPAPPAVGSVSPSEEQHNGDVPCLDARGCRKPCSRPAWAPPSIGPWRPMGRSGRAACAWTPRVKHRPGYPHRAGHRQRRPPSCGRSTRDLVNQASGCAWTSPASTPPTAPRCIYSCNGGPNQQWWLPEL